MRPQIGGGPAKGLSEGHRPSPHQAAKPLSSAAFVIYEPIMVVRNEGDLRELKFGLRKVFLQREHCQRKGTPA
jgi:hypothetical protein